MITAQAMMVGAVLAWTPSLLVFAWIVRDIRNTRGEELDELTLDPGAFRLPGKGYPHWQFPGFFVSGFFAFERVPVN
jgi:hypothetical protein